MTVPPKKPVIFTGSYGNETPIKVQSTFNEGSKMSLWCEVIGGSPPPQVTWYIGDKVQDGTFVRKHDGITINRLDIPVTRDLLWAKLICKANNTQLMTPLTSEIILDVNRECKSRYIR